MTDAGKTNVVFLSDLSHKAEPQPFPQRLCESAKRIGMNVRHHDDLNITPVSKSSE
jgi:hypothetical protein